MARSSTPSIPSSSVSIKSNTLSASNVTDRGLSLKPPKNTIFDEVLFFFFPAKNSGCRRRQQQQSNKAAAAAAAPAPAIAPIGTSDSLEDESGSLMMRMTSMMMIPVEFVELQAVEFANRVEFMTELIVACNKSRFDKRSTLTSGIEIENVTVSCFVDGKWFVTFANTSLVNETVPQAEEKEEREGGTREYI